MIEERLPSARELDQPRSRTAESLTTTPALSLVLACYNEGPTLEASLTRIVQAVRRLGEPFEVVAIDDASEDATADRLSPLLELHDDVQIVRHVANQGRGATVREGLALSRGMVRGFLDVDLEVGPEYIAPFYDAIRGGADVAIGRRVYPVSTHSLARMVMSRSYGWLARRYLRLPFRDTEAGYKFFSAAAAEYLVDKTSHPGWFWDTEVVVVAARGGLRVVDIPCLFIRRSDKKSTVRMVPDSIAYLKALIRYRRT